MRRRQRATGLRESLKTMSSNAPRVWSRYIKCAMRISTNTPRKHNNNAVIFRSSSLIKHRNRQAFFAILIRSTAAESALRRRSFGLTVHGGRASSRVRSNISWTSRPVEVAPTALPKDSQSSNDGQSLSVPINKSRFTALAYKHSTQSSTSGPHDPSQ